MYNVRDRPLVLVPWSTCTHTGTYASTYTCRKYVPWYAPSCHGTMALQYPPCCKSPAAQPACNTSSTTISSSTPIFVVFLVYIVATDVGNRRKNMGLPTCITSPPQGFHLPSAPVTDCPSLGSHRGGGMRKRPHTENYRIRENNGHTTRRCTALLAGQLGCCCLVLGSRDYLYASR